MCIDCFLGVSGLFKKTPKKKLDYNSVTGQFILILFYFKLCPFKFLIKNTNQDTQDSFSVHF